MNDPTIGTHEASNRMSFELGDCKNSKERNIRYYHKRQDCEDEELSTYGGDGNPSFVISTYKLVEDMFLYTQRMLRCYIVFTTSF
jgi:hypothetical protein